MGALNPLQALSLYAEPNPFASPAALRFSNYSALVDGSLVRLLDWREPPANAKVADEAVRGFLQSEAFSCVAGKATVATGGYRFGIYPEFEASPGVEGLARDLAAFVAERRSMTARYATFIAAFEGGSGDESWFETRLWRVLQRLHDLDSRFHPWDSSVSNDPAAVDFSFSFAGRAFFVVGLHPRSERRSRRFSMPALAFNAHAQFVQARQSSLFERIQSSVREREIALQGSINPELRGFGTRSEARQYSGRGTEDEWRCPFTPRS